MPRDRTRERGRAAFLYLKPERKSFTTNMTKDGQDWFPRTTDDHKEKTEECLNKWVKRSIWWRHQCLQNSSVKYRKSQSCREYIQCFCLFRDCLVLQRIGLRAGYTPGQHSTTHLEGKGLGSLTRWAQTFAPSSSASWAAGDRGAQHHACPIEGTSLLIFIWGES